MLISLKWLKNYINIPNDISPLELANKITTSVVEINDVIFQGEHLENIVVGNIIEINKHPNADKLNICQVDTGRHGILKIVCGGNNVRKDMTVPVVLPGARVKWHGQGDLITLEKTSIRGVESDGMIASVEEIGISSKYYCEGGIADLDLDKSYIGSDLKTALGLDDVIFDIENKTLTNRPDLWGHYGMAREIAVLLGVKFKNMIFDDAIFSKPDKKCLFDVVIEDTVACPRYVGIVVKDIKIKESPQWLVRQLEAVNIKSINNIVDITNFVMMELGQPLHAFDLKSIDSFRIIVRKAKAKEKFKTLDDQERILTSEDLLICDAKKPIAIAGIMGGKNSEIKNTTTDIFIESASFEAISIRKTSNRLGLRTEASTRFEKSLDPNLTRKAIIRAVELIKQLNLESLHCGKLIDQDFSDRKESKLNVSIDFINQKLGFEIPTKDILNILSGLNFSPKEKRDNSIDVVIPTYRGGADIKIKEDIVEEVARIYGYNNIKGIYPVLEIKAPFIDKSILFERNIKNFVSRDLKYNEVYNYSMISGDDISNILEKSDNFIELANSVSKNIKYLRNSLAVGILKNMKDNLRYFKKFQLFEVGRVFSKDMGEYKVDIESGEFLPKQDKILAISSVGADYYSFKGDLELILSNFGIKYISKIGENVFCEKEGILGYYVDEKLVAFLGIVSDEIRRNFDIKERVLYAEINLSKILKYKQNLKYYKPLPKYPSMTYDISMVVSNSLLWQDIEQAVTAISPLIETIEIFDVYDGEKIEKGKRSLAFHIVFSDATRTLTSKETENAMKSIKKMLVDKFKVSIR